MSDTLEFVVEDGTGLSNSTSFVSVAYADSYALLHGMDAWLQLSTEQKQVTLVLASDYVNSQYNWRGERIKSDQALALPRGGFRIPSGAESTGIPPCVKKVTVELASRCFSSESEEISYQQLVPDNQMAGTIKSYKSKLDVLEEQFTYAAPGELEKVRPFPGIDAMIESWLLNRKINSSSTGSVVGASLTGISRSEVIRQDADADRFTGFPKDIMFGG